MSVLATFWTATRLPPVTTTAFRAVNATKVKPGAGKSPAKAFFLWRSGAYLDKNSDWAGGDYDEIEDLLTSLEFVDPDRIPSDFPQKIISLVDPLFKMMPKLCSKVYHWLVRIGNYDNYRSEIQQYLLSKMCSDEKTHAWIILECLIDMKNPCPELKQEVQNLMNWTEEKWIGAHLREESAKVAAAWGL